MVSSFYRGRKPEYLEKTRSAMGKLAILVCWDWSRVHPACSESRAGNLSVGRPPDQWWTDYLDHSATDALACVSVVVRNRCDLFYRDCIDSCFHLMKNYRHFILKIKSFFALAPVAFLGHTKTKLRLLSDWPEWLYFDVFGKRDFLPSDWFFKFMAVTACNDKWTVPICTNTLFVICGYDYQNLNQSRLPVYIAHSPAGTSVKNMIHYSQAISTGKYQKYDYGTEGNRQHYGQDTPPQYNVRDMKTPVYLYSAGNDLLADPQDVSQLIAQLQTRYNSTEIPSWNHLDFAWGIDANRILYRQIIQILLNTERTGN